MTRIYIHLALECYSSFYGMEKFIGVPQFSFAFQTVCARYKRQAYHIKQTKPGTKERLSQIICRLRQERQTEPDKTG
jgi:hypothetical protein